MDIKRVFRLAAAIVFILWPVLLSSASDDSEQQKTAELEARVEEIRAKDNVSQRQDVNAIFELADMYASQDDANKARELYEAGLSIDSFRFDYQLKLANLLKQSDDTKQAIEKYKSVYAYAEDEEVVNSAKGQLLSLKVKCPSPKQKKRKFSIVVIPLGSINRVFADEMLSELNKITGIEYTFYEGEFPLGKLDRTDAEWYLSRMCEEIKKKSPEANPPADTNPKAQMEFVIKFLRDNGTPEDKIEEFRKEMLGNFQVGQRDADRLLSEIKARFVASEESGVVGYLGITEADIYSDDSNFLFGLAQPRFGVMSYCRFKADFNKEREYRPRLVERAVKQGLSSTFYILDIPRCTTAMCARAYSHSLEEQDLKKGELCSWCKEQLSKKLKELQKQKKK
jgi:predicted Zn-dependent protease